MCSVFQRPWIVFLQESGSETFLQLEGCFLLEILVNRKFPTTSLAQRQIVCVFVGVMSKAQWMVIT